MNVEEQRIAANLADAIKQLPDGKKEFLLGYAEGVAAMAVKSIANEEKQESKRRKADG